MQLYLNQPQRENFLINGGPRPNLGLYSTVSDPLCCLSSVNKRPLGFLNLVGQYRATLPDTHIHTHHGVTYTQQLSAYQHSPHTAPAFPPSSPFSHTQQHDTSIIRLPHTLHINSAAVLSASPALLPDILSVFLRASQEISFHKAAKPTHTTQNILKRLSGARQALNLTHTRIF